MAVPRKRGTRERICTECGALDIVRQDNTSAVCRSCSARRRGAVGLVTIRAKAAAKATFCPVCGFVKAATDSYCSVQCRMVGKRTWRTCKACSNEFQVFKSSLSGKTNASGNFCSRRCYEAWMCKTERRRGRGSQWRRIAQDVIRHFPFCSLCGARKQLQVHHIVPYRITFDNRPQNLIPLCPRCHKKVEVLAVEFEHAWGSNISGFYYLARLLRQRQAILANRINKLVRGCNHGCD